MSYIFMILNFFASLLFLLISLININPYKLSLKKYFSMIICISICFFMMYNFIPQLSTIPLYIIPILFIYSENHKFFESIIIGVFVHIVIILVDNLIGFILLYILGEEFLYSDYGYYISYITIAIMLYIVSKLINKVGNNYKNFIRENIKLKYTMLFIVVLIITFALFYFNINWNSSSNPVYLTKVNSINCNNKLN